MSSSPDLESVGTPVHTGPAETYDVTPCTVVAVGQEVADRFAWLQSSVEFWLGESFPARAVTWGAAITQPEATAKWAADLIDPLLSPELRDYLRDKEYVGSQAPYQEPTIRAYILFQPYELQTPHKELVDEYDVLSAAMRALQEGVSRRASLHISLVILLPPAIDVPKRLPIDLVDGCFVITPVQATGHGFREDEYETVYDVVRIALHALIASEAGEIMRQEMCRVKSSTSKPIFALGASAISTAVTHMRDYRVSKVFNLLVEPYLGDPSDEERDKRLDQGEALASNIEWVTPTLQVFTTQGWGWFQADDEGDICRVSPNPGGELGREIAQPTQDFRGFNEALGRVFIQLHRAFATELKGEAQSVIQRVLNPGIERVTNIAEGWRNELARNGDIDGRLGDGQRGSLKQVLYILAGFIQAVSAEALLDSRGDPVDPAYASDDKGWRAHALIVTVRARITQLAIDLLKQMTGNPIHIAIRVFPAWPLLALLLQTLTDMATWQTWLSSFVLVAVGSVLASLRWQGSLDVKKENAAGRRLNEIRPLAVGIASQQASRAHKTVKQVVAQIRGEVDRLEGYLRQRQAQHQNTVQSIEAEVRHLEDGRNSPLLEYILHDLPFCDRWAFGRVRAAIVDSSTGEAGGQSLPSTLYTQLLEIVRQTLGGELLGESAAYQVDRIAHQLVISGSYPPQLEAVELADHYPGLQRGKRWSWLYGQAVPMGPGEVKREITIVALYRRADLAGEAGDSAPEWKLERSLDWRVARSCQPHRITMLRVIPFSNS